MDIKIKGEKAAKRSSIRNRSSHIFLHGDRNSGWGRNDRIFASIIVAGLEKAVEMGEIDKSKVEPEEPTVRLPLKKRLGNYAAGAANTPSVINADETPLAIEGIVAAQKHGVEELAQMKSDEIANRLKQMRQFMDRAETVQ